jgi:hypothetical protein
MPGGESKTMNSYAIFRRNAWRDAAELERAASRSSRVCNEEMPDRVRWVRSYVCAEEDGTLGSVCIYQAVDADAVMEHALRARLPCDTLMPLVRAVIILDDPVP